MTDEATFVENILPATEAAAKQTPRITNVQTLPDRGPIYTETPADPYAPDAPAIAEPWNTVTASFFIFIAIYWLVRLRGRLAQHPMVACCMPILLVGGIGGTLYHAHRTRLAYFLLDVIPIQLLGLLGTIYLVTRIGQTLGVRKVLLVSLGVLSAFLFINGVLFRHPMFVSRFPTLVVNLNYASLAIVLLVPIVVVLLKTRFRHGNWIATSLASFGVAWFCRLVDPFVDPAGPLPMGTHWLWHTFGAITTMALIGYFYRIEGKTFAELSQPQPRPQTSASV